MRRKLHRLLEDHPVRIVHPIALDRWIIRLGDGGEVLGRRLSPKHGTIHDLFSELVAFPELINSPNLTIEVLLTREDEIRRHDSTRAWRRKGWVIEERHLIEVVERHDFAGAKDLAALLGDVPDQFTTSDVASTARCSRRVAQQMAYCLRRAGVITMVGKVGNAITYERC